MIPPVPEFRASRCLAASWSGNADPNFLHSLLNKLEGWEVRRGESWLIASEVESCLGNAANIAVATCVPQMFDRTSGELRTASTLAALLRTPGYRPEAELGEPFRLLWADAESGRLAAATGICGLGHLFWHAGPGVALVASSASLIASIIGASPEPARLIEFALLGAFPFESTPYQDVRKLEAGSTIVMEQGKASVSTIDGFGDGQPDLGESFRAAVAAMLSAAPEAGIELSGGLDSRLVLAAIPPEERARLHGITLTGEGGTSADARIASALAQRSGMDHRLISTAFGDFGSAEHLKAVLDQVIDGYDRMANPLDKVPLVLAGMSETARPRFGGQNGEIIRGFYYPMQPLDSRSTPQLVEKLVDWRLTVNDRVSDRLFSVQVQSDMFANAKRRLGARIISLGDPWGKLLDRFYLEFRMQSWAGNAASNRFVDRPILWPFFDRTFLTAALNAPTRDKRASRLAYQLLRELDPQLAAIAIDNGVIPARAARGGLFTRIDAASVGLKKARGKLLQRARRRPGSVLGASALGEQWSQLKAYRCLNADGLSRLGIFDEAALDSLVTGRWPPDRPTLGFLLLCDRIVSA